MLQPNRRKFRKEHKGRNTGIATRGAAVSFGDFGLKATERWNLFSALTSILCAGITKMSSCCFWARKIISIIRTPVNSKPIKGRHPCNGLRI